MGDIRTYDADWLLDQWARWSNYYPDGGGAHPLAQLLHYGSMPAPVICDDEALLVDGIVGELLFTMPSIGEAVVHYYRTGRNYCRVAEIMEVSRKVAAAEVQAGVAWVDGRINGCRGLDRIRKVNGCYSRPPVADNDDEAVSVMRDRLSCYLARVSNG